ncbi:MAG TPA: modification methylase [Desulfotomaculum sp.]|nr:MAG: DNA adenine methylase [Desulfotomaculum sp. 46_80]HAG11970.1 modification methylase [Desulfotomaculum sp.]HBY04752.1 modification methylase [Desulfotomaculum sp.]
MVQFLKPAPLIKWAGGKGQLIFQIRPFLPGQTIKLYLEPFVGGGAMFFHLQPLKAVLIDNNPELINFYTVVRDNLESLLVKLAGHENSKEYYYRIRALEPEAMEPVDRASRFLYLNKTSYNGLYRVNKKGRHNVPFGRYKNPRIIDRERLSLANVLLQTTILIFGDFSSVLDFAKPGAFIYLDPPYQPLSTTSNFTSYTSEAFSEQDQYRLAKVFKKLDQRRCFVMLSNSDTPLIREIYSSYNQTILFARRAINCQAGGRGPVSELLIRNYD